MLIDSLLKLGILCMIAIGFLMVGYIIGIMQPYIFDGDKDEIDDDEVFNENRPEETEKMQRPESRG